MHMSLVFSIDEKGWKVFGFNFRPIWDWKKPWNYFDDLDNWNMYEGKGMDKNRRNPSYFGKDDTF